LKIILTKDFENLGSLGDTLEVKDGYANNFLIPREIAARATKGNIKQMEIVNKSIMKKVVIAHKDLLIAMNRRKLY